MKTKKGENAAAVENPFDAKLNAILAKNPDKVNPPVKVVAARTITRKERDYFGQRADNKMSAVNAAIKALAIDKGRPDLVNPENLSVLSGIDAKKIKGHLAWFERKFDFNPYNQHKPRPRERADIAFCIA